jgi:hypothetical protein
MRVRWPIAFATSALAPILLGVVVAVVVRPVGLGMGLAIVVAGVLSAIAVRRVRRRTLSVSPDGLVVQRDKYGLHAPWEAVVGVQRRRLQGVLAVDELALSESTPVARNSRGQSSRLPSTLAGHPAALRIQVSVYDKNWRNGPIGNELRLRGVL